MGLRIFFITYGAANVSLILYGILALWRPGILLESFLLHVYQFPRTATAAMDYLSALFRLLGFFNLLPGLLGLILLRQYRFNRQQWVLHVVMASSLLAYLGPIVFDNTVGEIGFFEILEHALFVAMILVGIPLLRGIKPI